MGQVANEQAQTINEMMKNWRQCWALAQAHLDDLNPADRLDTALNTFIKDEIEEGGHAYDKLTIIGLAITAVQRSRTHSIEGIDAAVARMTKPQKDKKSLSRKARLFIVAFAAWSVFVFARTATSFELLGFDLYRWRDDYLLLNWLLPPVVFAGAAIAYRWIKRAQ